MAIMSETMKAARKAQADLEKRLLAAEKSFKRSLARATKFDVKGALAKLREPLVAVPFRGARLHRSQDERHRGTAVRR